MPDSLGDRIKGQYEDRTRFLLPRRTYTLIRVDGKAFHTLTRPLEQPYDARFVVAIDSAALHLCMHAQGSCFSYIQSDEISVLLTDFASVKTEGWFDGNIQKIASVSASVVTAGFNAAIREMDIGMGFFDARVWTIPDPTEVENYFIWRQQDAERNSLSMYARSYFSHAQLHGKAAPDMHQMLYDVGVNWNDLPAEQKRGRAIVAERNNGGWIVRKDIPVFTTPDGREWLRRRIPRYE